MIAIDTADDQAAITAPAAAERDVIPISFVRQALQEVRRRGFDAGATLGRAGIDPALLQDDHAVVTPDQFTRLWRFTVELLGDELFGLDARGMPPGSYTLLAHAVLHSPTLERAIGRALRFFGLLLSDFDGRLVRTGDRAQIVLIESGPPRCALAYGAFWVMLQALTCWLIDKRIPLLAADFRGAPPAFPEHYRRVFCDNLQFDRPRTSIQFDASYLAFKPMRTEAQMKTFLREAPKVFLTQYRNRDSLSATIWRRLRSASPANWPDFETLAAALHTTSSTLRRRLDEEGATYQQIKDGIRRERAISQLRLNLKSNAEIAAELGFGDPSTFYRAFKKWTGATPDRYRRPPCAPGGASSGSVSKSVSKLAAAAIARNPRAG